MVNIGETLAILIRHDLMLYVQPTGDVSNATQHPVQLECRELKPGESAAFLVDIIIGSESEYDFAWNFAVAGTLRIRGRIEYKDTRGITRRTGFLRTYDVELGRFRASGDTEEEYED